MQKTADTRKRVALVIGNGSYVVSPLKNPANDAKSMAATLRRLGFQVEEQTNLGFAQMNKAVESFGKKLKPGGIGLFYYAGHGIQVSGANYLIPVDAEIEDENEVRYKSVDAGLVLAKMEQARSDVNIVILDACRNNPFARSFRFVSRGLASMDAPSGSLIAYATAPGRTAADGERKNGVYTEELIRMMETPGLTVEEALKRVRKAVMRRTSSTQVPWEASSLTGDFHFIPPTELTDLRPAPSQPAAQPPSAGNAPPQQATLRGFTDVTTGMEFVPVKGGCFRMGSPFEDSRRDEKPVHEVCLSDFFIGRYEVTLRQWQKAMGGKSPDMGGIFVPVGETTEFEFVRSKEDCLDCPVRHVSWEEVQEFILKLNKQTGSSFRLPTEAEWEYACRSGGKDQKYCGDSKLDELAWHNKNSGDEVHAVGQKKPNGLDIYDMSGNVWELVSDWYGENYYADSPRDNPQGPATGKGRVIRGDSSIDAASHAYDRGSINPGTRDFFQGFRLVAPVQ